ncbi:DNA repair protein RAD51 homolog 4, partial [Striga asiatica]
MSWKWTPSEPLLVILPHRSGRFLPWHETCSANTPAIPTAEPDEQDQGEQRLDAKAPFPTPKPNRDMADPRKTGALASFERTSTRSAIGLTHGKRTNTAVPCPFLCFVHVLDVKTEEAIGIRRRKRQTIIHTTTLSYLERTDHYTTILSIDRGFFHCLKDKTPSDRQIPDLFLYLCKYKKAHTFAFPPARQLNLDFRIKESVSSKTSDEP